MDALVVLTEDLANVIAPWWRARAADSAYSGQAWGAWTSGQMSATAGDRGAMARGEPMPSILAPAHVLARSSGVQVRTLWAVTHKQTTWTGYYCRADKILSALGLTDQVGEGKAVPLWANPFVNPDNWVRQMRDAGVVGDPYEQLGARCPWEWGYDRGALPPILAAS